MAEIHVQAKKHQSTSWLWIVLGLLLVAAVIYFMTRNKETDNRVETNTTTTGALVTPQWNGAHYHVA
jgi:hypothetical protein